jgi:D-beta-D-heptose 7-phosphate kinase/D-beta-D-heptose 1-phosphate adenosyltransferase
MKGALMADIGAILGKIKGAKVLCLGDLMLDRYVYGEATRLSPEAPVPIVAVRRQVLVPGGLGNVVMNLAALGAGPLAVGLAGSDQSADSLESLMAGALDPLSRPLIRDPGRPTPIKTRVMAGIQQIARFDEELIAPLSSEVEAEYLKSATESLPLVSAVILSDYGKGVVSPFLSARVVEAAGKLGLPVVVDPKGDDYGRYRGATLVTPNRQELALAAGRDIARAPQEVLTASGFGLMSRHGLGNLLITRSEEGMTLLGSDGTVRQDRKSTRLNSSHS